MYWNQDFSWLIGYRDWFAPESWRVCFASSIILFFTFNFFIFYYVLFILLFFIHYYFLLFYLEPKTTSRRAGLSARAEFLVVLVNDCVDVCSLTADEYSSLSSNLVDIVSVHKDLLSSLEDTFRFEFSRLQLMLEFLSHDYMKCVTSVLHCSNRMPNPLSILTAIFPGEPQLASFIAAEGDGSPPDINLLTKAPRTATP